MRASSWKRNDLGELEALGKGFGLRVFLFAAFAVPVLLRLPLPRLKAWLEPRSPRPAREDLPPAAAEAIVRRIDAGNADAIVAGASAVLDGSDNFATRLAVADACTAARVPLVSAAIGQFQAQIGTFRGWEDDQPCYRCFVGDAFDAEDCDTCSELGVLGAMAGIAGTFAALEVIRQIAGFGPDQAGKLHVFDGLAPAMRTIRIAKDPACSACGSH